MPNISCPVCSKTISNAQTKITCFTCSKMYHGNCSKLTANDISYIGESGENWSCASCTSNIRVLRSNSCSSSPVDKSMTKNQSVNMDQLKPDQFASIMEKLSVIAAEIGTIKTTQLDLVSEIASIKNNQGQLVAKIEKCTAVLDQHGDIIGQHEISINKCSASVQELTSKYTNLSSDVQVLQNQVVSLEGDADNGLSSSVTRISEPSVSEALERLRRASNVVMRGIPESNNVHEDQRRVAEVLKIIDNVSSQQILSTTRLGSSSANTRPRPIKVSFGSAATAHKILRNKKALTGTQFKNILIQDDKTPQQLNQLSVLREQLKSRQEQGESDITIKYVKGIPTIVSTQPKN